MADSRLSFYQIYYKDSQLPSLFPFAIPYKNDRLTPYFENDVILKVVPECKSDLIAVCSHALAWKRSDNLRTANRQLTIDNILNADFDIARLIQRSPNHKMLHMAAQWHKNWAPCIAVLKKKFAIPREVDFPIYENHFIARREIYHEYIDFLKSVIEVIEENKEVFMLPSGYIKYKKKEIQQHVKSELGLDDYPMIPFILERMFSIFIHNKPFKKIDL